MSIDPLLAAYATWADLAACTMIWAIVRSRRAAPRVKRACSRRVLVVRPCTGRDAYLEPALRSSRSLAGLDVSVVCAVRDEADPAAEIARRAGARVVLTGARGANRKAAQIAAVLEIEQDWDVLVIADADVELDRCAIAELLAPLDDERVGATWAPPVETAPLTFADRASASVLDASLHAFPLLSALDPRGMVGKLFAVKRAALARAGGFSTLVDRLGEDMELARRLRAAGDEIVAVNAFARSLASGRGAREVVERYARWIAVVRAQRAALLPAYPLLLASAPSFIALAIVLAAAGRPLALAACAIVLAVRLAVAVAARVRTRRPLRPATLLLAALAADALLLVAFVRAIASARVVWRGVELRVSRGRVASREGERPSHEDEHGLGDAHP